MRARLCRVRLEWIWRHWEIVPSWRAAGCLLAARGWEVGQPWVREGKMLHLVVGLSAWSLAVTAAA